MLHVAMHGIRITRRQDGARPRANVRHQLRRPALSYVAGQMEPRFLIPIAQAPVLLAHAKSQITQAAPTLVVLSRTLVHGHPAAHPARAGPSRMLAVVLMERTFRQANAPTVVSRLLRPKPDRIIRAAPTHVALSRTLVPGHRVARQTRLARLPTPAAVLTAPTSRQAIARAAVFRLRPLSLVPTTPGALMRAGLLQIPALGPQHVRPIQRER